MPTQECRGRNAVRRGLHTPPLMIKEWGQDRLRLLIRTLVREGKMEKEAADTCSLVK